MAESDPAPAGVDRFKLIDDAAARLGEWFDAIVIVGTYPSDEVSGASAVLHAGRGNWYARYGCVRELCEAMEARFGPQQSDPDQTEASEG